MVGPPSEFNSGGGFWFYATKGVPMRISGWIFMLFAWTCILSLAIFSFGKVLKRHLGREEENENQAREKDKTRR